MLGMTPPTKSDSKASLRNIGTKHTTIRAESLPHDAHKTKVCIVDIHVNEHRLRGTVKEVVVLKCQERLSNIGHLIVT